MGEGMCNNFFLLHAYENLYKSMGNGVQGSPPLQLHRDFQAWQTLIQLGAPHPRSRQSWVSPPPTHRSWASPR